LIQLAESFVVAAPVFAPKLVVAYIDPGTGSMLFQVALAAILSITVAWRQLRARFKLFFAKPDALPPAPTAAAPTAAAPTAAAPVAPPADPPADR
jgi:hypothetical protein